VKIETWAKKEKKKILCSIFFFREISRKTTMAHTYDDMTLMDNMTLEAVLENVHLRYEADKIYTYTGSILVAINPFKSIENLYSTETQKRYVGKRIGTIDPHVFAIAEAAYAAMTSTGKDQSVLISGESGAGKVCLSESGTPNSNNNNKLKKKRRHQLTQPLHLLAFFFFFSFEKTETTKLILRYLTQRSSEHHGDAKNSVEQKILESVPILEALGNAKTLRNDNSSRFGKYIEVQFNSASQIVGSRIIPYLLEKSRITSQLEGERNFHVFYQLTEGASAEVRERYHFRDAMHYNYLNRSGCIALSRENYDESRAREKLEAAMALFGIGERLRDRLYSVLSAVLHCGNIEWRDHAEQSGVVELAGDEAQRAASVVAEMIGVESERLVYVLSHRKIVVAGEPIWKDLDAEAARQMTDAFAKAMYSKLFLWMVRKLNSAMHADAAEAQCSSVIGVLDIFGFENFAQNGFEQFLINLANEKLQQFFNTYIFALEQAEYEREEVDWTKIEFQDNQPVLDLIERGRPPGILALLDDQCRAPRATEKTFVDGCHHHFGAPGAAPAAAAYAPVRLKPMRFAIEHYAGGVEYDVGGWLEKNKDELPPHLVELMIDESDDAFLSLLFTEKALDAPPADKLVKTPRGGGGAAPGSAASIAASLLQKHRRSDSAMDLARARFAAAAEKRQAPASSRPSVSSSSSSSSSAAAKTKRTTTTTGAYFKQQLGALMTALGDTEPFFIRTIKPNMHARPNDFNASEITAQLRYAGMLETIRIRRLGYPVRHRFADFQWRFQVIEPSFERVPDNERQSCASLVKALGLDGHAAQVGKTKAFLKQDAANDLEDRRGVQLHDAVVRLQTWWRAASARMRYVAQREAAVKIQSQWRGFVQERAYLRLRDSAIVVQSLARRMLARRIVAERRAQRAKELKALSAKEQAAREQAAREREELERDKVDAIKRGDLSCVARPSKPPSSAAAASSSAADKDGGDKEARRRRRRRRRAAAAEGQKSGPVELEQGGEAFIPIRLDRKIAVAVGWQHKRAQLSTTCLMFRYEKLRDAVHELNDLSRDAAIEHLGSAGGVAASPSPSSSSSSAAAVADDEQVAAEDREQMAVNLSRVSLKTNTLVFVVNLFSKGATWRDVGASYVRIVDQRSRKELARFDVPFDEDDERAATAGMVMCKLTRVGISQWKLHAVGLPREGRNYKLMVSQIQNMLPPPPRVRAFDVTVHGAKGLKAMRNGSTDAYAVAHLDIAKFQTGVVKRDVSPSWNIVRRIIAQGNAFEFHVWARFRWSNDVPIGKVAVQFAEHEELRLERQWFKLSQRGQIQVSIVSVALDAPLPKQPKQVDADSDAGGNAESSSALSSSGAPRLKRSTSLNRLRKLAISKDAPTSAADAAVAAKGALAAAAAAATSQASAATTGIGGVVPSLVLTTGVTATPRAAPEYLARQHKLEQNSVIQRFEFHGFEYMIKTVPLNAAMSVADMRVAVAERIGELPDTLEIWQRERIAEGTLVKLDDKATPLVVASKKVSSADASLQTPRGSDIRSAKAFSRLTAKGRLAVSKLELVVRRANAPPPRPSPRVSTSSSSKKSSKKSSKSKK
jgi:Myosin head (motor domain)/TerD domain/C2 domain/IQ calmodulin-binding motif